MANTETTQNTLSGYMYHSCLGVKVPALFLFSMAGIKSGCGRPGYEVAVITYTKVCSLAATSTLLFLQELASSSHCFYMAIIESKTAKLFPFQKIATLV